MKLTKKSVVKKLVELNMDLETSEMIAEAAMICRKRRICPLDINLCSIYPILGDKFGFKDTTIKTRMIKGLKLYRESNDTKELNNIIGNCKKITLKKLLIVILTNFESL